MQFLEFCIKLVFDIYLVITIIAVPIPAALVPITGALFIKLKRRTSPSLLIQHHILSIFHILPDIVQLISDGV